MLNNVKLTITNAYGLPPHVYSNLAIPEDPDEAHDCIYECIDEYVADIILHRPDEIMFVLTEDFINSIDFIVEIIPQEDEEYEF